MKASGVGEITGKFLKELSQNSHGGKVCLFDLLIFTRQPFSFPICPPSPGRMRGVAIPSSFSLFIFLFFSLSFRFFHYFFFFFFRLNFFFVVLVHFQFCRFSSFVSVHYALRFIQVTSLFLFVFSIPFSLLSYQNLLLYSYIFS